MIITEAALNTKLPHPDMDTMTVTDSRSKTATQTEARMATTNTARTLTERSAANMVHLRHRTRATTTLYTLVRTATTRMYTT